MKKVLTIVCLLIMIFSFNINVKAKTINDMKKELASLQDKKKKQTQQKQLTQKEMDRINSRVLEINNTITVSEKTIKNLTEEIAELEIKSAEKEEEIKDIVSFLQVTNSNNAYMEYIFGSKSITDLIFRSAISEQMVSHNNDLIEEYTDTVKKNNEKKVQLDLEIKSLEVEQINLKAEFDKLGDQVKDIVEITTSIDDEILSVEKAIKYYQNLGCGPDQDTNSCVKVPFSNRMVRPIASGAITSSYGMRQNPLNPKEYKFHNGIDITGNTNVYALAPGIVKYKRDKQSCGGNMLYIEYNINGVSYTSGYYHLAKFNVNVGDFVDQNTIVGVMGGAKWSTPWDSCSTGTHLHLSLAVGSWNGLSSFSAKQINPTSVINFPAKGKWFSNRTTKY